MRRSNRVFLAVLVPAAFVSTASAQSEPLEITLNLKEGQVFRYRITHEQEQEAQLSGLQPIKTRMRITSDMTHTVAGVASDGTTTVNMKYDRLAVQMRAGVTRIDYDSAGQEPAENDVVAKMYGAIVGKQIQARFSREGRCIDVTGFGEIVPEMVKAWPEAAGIADVLKETFSDEATRSMFAKLYPRLPEKPIKPGDIWADEAKASVPAIGAVTTKLSSQFVGIETVAGRRCARLNKTGQISTEGGAVDLSKVVGTGAGPLGLVKTDLHMEDSRIAGHTCIDVETGYQVQTQTDFEMSMKLTLEMPVPDPAGAGSTNTIRMTQNIKSKASMTMELIE